MDAIFRTAFDRMPLEADVLRVRLRPLTIGHLLLLGELDSPLLNPFAEVSRQALIAAVIVCSVTQDRSRDALLSMRTRWALRFLGWLNRKQDLETEVAKFRAYLEENRRPPGWRCPAGGKPRHAPEAWRLLVMLLRDFHFTMPESLNCWVRTALCLWLVDSEAQGAVELMPSDPFNEARLAALRERAAQGGRG